jgi:hypothetical protein
MFSSTIVMMSSAQPQQKVPSQGQQLSPQLQQQLQQQGLASNVTASPSPQLQQQLQKQQQPQLQDEQQEMKYELQRLRQQGLPATTEEEKEGKITKGTPKDFIYTEDGPQIEDLQRLQALAPPGSQLRAKILGPTTGALTPQAQTTITAPPPKTVFPVPTSPQPQPDTGALAAGCKTGLYERVNPEWLPASRPPSGSVPSVAEGIITPSKVTVTHHDFPFNHQSHDENFHVKVDPKYTGLASTAHPQDANGQRTMEMEWEIGSASTGITDRFPKEFWPWEGDRVWMIGRWVWDCGHFNATPTPHGYQTEIHPPFATAFTRNQPYQFPGENKPSSATVTYIYIHGQGGYYNTPVGGQNYQFDIPILPKPCKVFCLPTVQLRSSVIGLPFGGPAPTVTAKSQLCNFAGTMTPCARVVVPLSGIPPSPNVKYGAAVAVKWIDMTRPIPEPQGFRTLRVTFDSIRVNEDHDYFSGEWNKLWVGVNGKWIELSGPSGHYGLNDVDNGDLIRFPAGKSVTVIVPDKGVLKIQTSGWEDDNDGYYGRRILSFPPPAGALNDNDKIGVVIKPYTAANNFGIGPHSDFSGTTGPSETNRDFTLNYRIQQLGFTPPTTQPPAKLPTAPTQPPVLK